MESLLRKEYEEKIFNYGLEYIKIYDTYLNNFLNNMTDYITQIENSTLQKIENLYNIFMDHFNPNSTNIYREFKQKTIMKFIPIILIENKKDIMINMKMIIPY